MYSWKESTIWAAASVGGGLLLTLLSGLYMEKPFILDAEIIFFGFPFPWLEAGRSTWKQQLSWSYLFLWQGFISDLIIYGLLTAAIVWLYFTTVPKRRR